MSKTLRLTIGDKHLSSWSLRPWLVFKMFDIPFEEDPIRLDQPDTAEEIARRTEAGKVPVLNVGNLTVWDSLAIIEYLADKFPDKAIWPMAGEPRAVARSVSAEMHSGFAALRQQWPMKFTDLDVGSEMTPELERDIERIDAIWDFCRGLYGAGGPFLFGDFSAADAMFAPVVSRFMTYRGKTGDSDIDAYCQAVWALPAMKEWGEGARAELDAR